MTMKQLFLTKVSYKRFKVKRRIIKVSTKYEFSIIQNSKLFYQKLAFTNANILNNISSPGNSIKFPTILNFLPWLSVFLIILLRGKSKIHFCHESWMFQKFQSNPNGKFFGHCLHSCHILFIFVAMERC